jgi:hypothetical protein
MKTLLLFGAIALSLNSFGQVPAYVPTNGLNGWWPFNGNANDESVNTNNGTVDGSILTTDRFGTPNSAYLFDGIDDFIQASSVISNIDTVSISLWVQLNNDQGGSYIQIGHDGGGFCNGYGLGNGGTDFSNIGLNLYTLSSCNGWNNSTYDVTVSNWFNLIFIKENLSGSYYMDGVFLGSQNLIAINQPSDSVYFGNAAEVGGFSLNGKLDDIGIWNRSLSQCEIQEIFNAQLTIDNTVTQNGALLSADQAGATYQWLACDDNNAQINGETNQTYTPSVTGNYSVEVTLNGCVDTSACKLVDFTGLDEINNSTIKVYPNPTKGSFNIEVDANIVGSNYVIYDQIGKVVQNGIINNPSQMINVVELSKGIYNLTIDNSDIRVKLIKE